MIYTIKNKYITAKISSHGAELVSLVDNDGIERMHTASPDTWNEVSPILFPTVSRFKDYLYNANNVEYKMPIHGFFKSMDLEPINHHDDSIEFEIQDDENTKKLYPYSFKFNVKYTIFNNKLIVSFKIKNTGENIMYYMLGGHPGFKVPLYDNEKYEDYYVEFEKNETNDAMQVVDGYLANEYKRYLTNENRIDLRHDLFVPDAICLTKLKSNYVDLRSNTNDKILRFYFSDFKILAIWSKTKINSDFVCFEPWNGIQHDFVKDIEKMGVLKLNSNKISKYSYTIELK